MKNGLNKGHRFSYAIISRDATTLYLCPVGQKLCMELFHWYDPVSLELSTQIYREALTSMFATAIRCSLFSLELSVALWEMFPALEGRSSSFSQVCDHTYPKPLGRVVAF